MKRIFLLAALLVASVSTSFAQFGWGVKAGVVVSNIRNMELNSKAGITAGVWADYKFTDRMALSADLLYSRQGGKGTDMDDEGNVVDGKLRQHYLNVPILFNYYVIGNLAVKAGIQPGFNLGTKLKVGDEKISLSNITKTMDLTIPVGVSYEWGGLLFDARYNIGVTNIGKGDGGNLYNRYFTFTVGWRF